MSEEKPDKVSVKFTSQQNFKNGVEVPSIPLNGIDLNSSSESLPSPIERDHVYMPSTDNLLSVIDIGPLNEPAPNKSHLTFQGTFSTPSQFIKNSRSGSGNSFDDPFGSTPHSKSDMSGEFPSFTVDQSKETSIEPVNLSENNNFNENEFSFVGNFAFDGTNSSTNAFTADFGDFQPFADGSFPAFDQIPTSTESHAAATNMTEAKPTDNMKQSFAFDFVGTSDKSQNGSHSGFGSFPAFPDSQQEFGSFNTGKTPEADFGFGTFPAFDSGEKLKESDLEKGSRGGFASFGDAKDGVEGFADFGSFQSPQETPPAVSSQGFGDFSPIEGTPKELEKDFESEKEKEKENEKEKEFGGGFGSIDECKEEKSGFGEGKVAVDSQSIEGRSKGESLENEDEKSEHRKGEIGVEAKDIYGGGDGSAEGGVFQADFGAFEGFTPKEENQSKEGSIEEAKPSSSQNGFADFAAFDSGKGFRAEFGSFGQTQAPVGEYQSHGADGLEQSPAAEEERRKSGNEGFAEFGGFGGTAQEAVGEPKLSSSQNGFAGFGSQGFPSFGDFGPFGQTPEEASASQNGVGSLEQRVFADFEQAPVSEHKEGETPSWGGFADFGSFQETPPAVSSQGFADFGSFEQTPKAEVAENKEEKPQSEGGFAEFGSVGAAKNEGIGSFGGFGGAAQAGAVEHKPQSEGGFASFGDAKDGVEGFADFGSFQSPQETPPAVSSQGFGDFSPIEGTPKELEKDFESEKEKEKENEKEKEFGGGFGSIDECKEEKSGFGEGKVANESIEGRSKGESLENEDEKSEHRKGEIGVEAKDIYGGGDGSAEGGVFQADFGAFEGFTPDFASFPAFEDQQPTEESKPFDPFGAGGMDPAKQGVLPPPSDGFIPFAPQQPAETPMKEEGEKAEEAKNPKPFDPFGSEQPKEIKEAAIPSSPGFSPFAVEEKEESGLRDFNPFAMQPPTPKPQKPMKEDPKPQKAKTAPTVPVPKPKFVKIDASSIRELIEKTPPYTHKRVSLPPVMKVAEARVILQSLQQ